MIDWKNLSEEHPNEEGKSYLVCLEESKIICVATWSNSLKRFFSFAFKGDNPKHWAEINYPEMIKTDFKLNIRKSGNIADDDCNERMPITKE